MFLLMDILLLNLMDVLRVIKKVPTLPPVKVIFLMKIMTLTTPKRRCVASNVTDGKSVTLWEDATDICINGCPGSIEDSRIGVGVTQHKANHQGSSDGIINVLKQKLLLEIGLLTLVSLIYQISVLLILLLAIIIVLYLEESVAIMVSGRSNYILLGNWRIWQFYLWWKRR